MQGMPIQLLTPVLNTKGVGELDASKKMPTELGESVGVNFEGLLSELIAGQPGKSVETEFTAKEKSIIELFEKQGVEFSPEDLEAAVKLASTNFNPNDIKFSAKHVSADTTSNVNPNDVKIPAKLASGNSNLDELIHSIRNKNHNPSQVEARLRHSSEIDETSIAPESEVIFEDDSSFSSPLDFLIKEGKPRELGQLKSFGENEAGIKKFVSSEEFIGLKNEAKISKNPIGLKNETNIKEQDFSNLIAKKMNLGEYGGRQSLLNDNLIRSTQDLAFNDRRSKIDYDELKNPDLKIGHDLSMIKESFIPNVQNLSNQLETNVGGSEKVLDLSSINTSNTNEIIKNISNYIEQNQIMNADSIDLNVKHAELGQFKILVNKNVDQNVKAMDLQIVTTTTEGHEFFAKNEIGLIKTLSQAGIQLSDFKLVQGNESSNLAQGDSKHNHHSNAQAGKEFTNSNGSNPQDGSERRKDLWEEARNLKERFGA